MELKTLSNTSIKTCLYIVDLTYCINKIYNIKKLLNFIIKILNFIQIKSNLLYKLLNRLKCIIFLRCHSIRPVLEFFDRKHLPDS